MLALPTPQLEHARVISPQTLVNKQGERDVIPANRPAQLQAVRAHDSTAVGGTAPGGLEIRLIEQGIAPARAAALVRRVPAEQIERQLGWIDRRRFRNRAATLIRAIEEDFAPPALHRPSNDRSAASFDPGKFFRGAYAVCPECGARPCAADCSAHRDCGAPQSVFS